MTRVANHRGPLGQKDPKPAKQPRKPMRKVSRKRTAQKKETGIHGLTGPQYMAHVADLPCVICGSGNVDVHHCCHGRFSARRTSDFDTIPLCMECHRHPHPNAIHTNKAAWAAKNGPDTGFIKRTRNLVEEMRQSIDF